MTKSRYRTGEFSLTSREYEKILDVCQSLEEELLIKLAVSTGLRRIDISRIKLADINLKSSKLIYLEHKKDRMREIPLSPKITQLLTKYINTLSKDRKFLFPWGKSRYGDRTAHRRLHSLCVRAEIPTRPFHSLRATCVKFCQKAGWSPEQVAELTGDSIRVIQEHYSTPSKQEMGELVKEKEVI